MEVPLAPLYLSNIEAKIHGKTHSEYTVHQQRTFPIGQHAQSPATTLSVNDNDILKERIMQLQEIPETCSKKDIVFYDIEEEDPLIPIRIDIDLNGKRYSDAFCWSKKERFISPEYFVNAMAKEMKLDEKMADCIALSLRQQIACASTRIITPKTECLVQLTVDVQYQDISIQDRLEWDLSSRENSPEVYAASLGRDLNLPPIVISLLAWSVRDKLSHYQLLFQYPPKNKYDCIHTLPPVKQAIRPKAERDRMQPILSQLNDKEVLYMNNIGRQFKSARTHARAPPSSRRYPFSVNYAPSSREPIRGPRSITAFFAFCTAQRSSPHFNSKQNSSEVTKMHAETWRNFSEEQREPYSILAENENKRKKMEFNSNTRRSAVLAWEEADVRRRKMLNTSYNVDADHVTSLLLQEYMTQRAKCNSAD